MKTKFNRVNHVLRVRLHNGDVSAMLKRTLIAVAIIIWVVFMSCMLLAWGVNAQSPDCPGVVSPYGRIANVRPQPNLAVSPVATLASGNSLPSGEALRGWYPLCEGNYISESVARYMTNTSQPTLQPTPTRIAAQIIYCISQPDVIQIELGLWRVICKYR